MKNRNGVRHAGLTGMLAAIIVMSAIPKVMAQDIRLAMTPPMGFNTWNAFEAKIDEAKVKAIADIMVSSGMRDAGYTYLVLDDGWMAAERDAAGNLQADPVKFPAGMKAIGDYIHSKGLQFGIYECRGFKTCQGLPGSFQHEQADMNSFASWGVDYIKLDACYAEKTGLLTSDHLRIFHECIQRTGRPMILSISDFGNGAWAWGGKEFGQLWRTSYDIYPWLESTYHCASTSGGSQSTHPGFNGLWQFAGPGHWNDPDMLEVGNLKNETENRAHFSLWCILAAPLMAGCDLRTMSDTVIRIFTAKEVIAVNQDKRGHQGYIVYKKGGAEIYNKPLADGTTAILFLNKDSLPADMTVEWKQVGLSGSPRVRDLWLQKDLGNQKDGFAVKGMKQNEIRLIKVGTPGGPPIPGPQPAPLEKYSITKPGLTSLMDIWYIMKSGDEPRVNKSYNGEKILVAGVPYDKGLGCKTESRIMYKLNGKADRFQASVGIDDSYAGNETGRFRVLIEDWFGNKPLFDSGKMTKGDKAIDIDIDVRGLQFILLEFRGKEDIIGNWIDPRIVGSDSQASGKVFPGADSKTPSRSEYYSWINNTNEGTTAQQTLANLDFFKWLQDQYGMVLDIYAFDAGAIDGAGYYGSINSPKFKAQFPEGFKPLAAQAATMGTRFGIWGGPDGFGNSKVEEDERIGLMTSLCRDYRFELFKFDAVCGDLRTEKQDVFIRMMTECRKYNPDLILLNHRLNLGKEGLKHATTWLLGGAETYIDVHMANDSTAPHHRAGALSRELVPELQRLTEDSGVCLSSCLDYWEDDLILQAFNRNLILAPEIYGNPWLLRDDEYPKLASIFNLARKYRNILVNGIILPEDKYGEKAVSRGDDQTRIITLRNNSWLPVIRTIHLDEEIGLSKGSDIELRQFHPVERLIGRYKKRATVTVEVLPFRSCLLIASSAKQGGTVVENCDYEIVQAVDGKPEKINLLGFPGEKKTVRINGKSSEIVFPGKPLKEKYHRKLADLKPVPVPADAEALYEATCFAADNNALEARSLERSGPTAISQVQKARDAFFNQQLFIDRGLWDKYLFDGDVNTAFYPGRRWGRNDIRINGGALRIDLGRPASLDSLRFIIGEERGLQPFRSWYDFIVEFSTDLKKWTPVTMIAGKEMSVILDPAIPVRYVRLPGSPEKVCEIEGYKNGKLVDRSRWRASNLFSQYSMVTPKEAFETSFVLNEIPKGSYLAIALNGKHGNEGAYAAIRVNGKPVGAPDRSLSYRSNAWEYPVQTTESNYTYYVPLTPDMTGAKIDATVLVLKNGVSEFKPEVWITAYPIPYEKASIYLQ